MQTRRKGDESDLYVVKYTWPPVHMHLKALLNTNMSVWQLHLQSSEKRNYKIVHNAAKITNHSALAHSK